MKKVFEAIAAEFRFLILGAENDIEISHYRLAAERLSSVFKGFDPAFNKTKFLKACGLLTSTTEL